MTYKIIETRQADITLITKVEFNFDGVISIVEIPHFMPKSQAEIEQNIINAAQGELAKLNAIQQIEALLPTLPINEEKQIE
jgi:hypothetical protein